LGLECNHKYGTINNKRKIIKVAQEGRHLDVLWSFYIYKARRIKPKLNKQNVTDTNVLFNLIINRDKAKRSNEQVSW
jgi:hypothetical protein